MNQDYGQETLKISSAFEPSLLNCVLWGKDEAVFKLDHFLISKESRLRIDGEAVEKLLYESFGALDSVLDKLFAVQQLMIGSVVLLDAFEFNDIQQLKIGGSNQPQQSWLEIALTSSLIVSYVKN